MEDPKKAPLAARVLEQIARLGGEFDERPGFKQVPVGEFGVSFYRDADGVNWEQADPVGEVTHVPAAIAYFFNHVRLPDLCLDDGELEQLELGTASEGWDLDVDGERAVLIQFAWIPASQFCYCFNLRDDSSDPTVVFIDHDGSGAGAVGTLSEFLAECVP